MLRVVQAVRRDHDDELCGHIEFRGGRWSALTVFGAVLGIHESSDDALNNVLADGLASLAERWTLRNGANGEDEVVCIVEANEHTVTVARGYYALPGVPTLVISAEQIADGEWELRR